MCLTKLAGILLSVGHAMLPPAVAIPARGIDTVAQGDLGTVGDTGQLSTITTDTGAFAPGRVSFMRYSTIGMCIAAANATLELSARTLAAQVLADTLQADTIGYERTAQVARYCGARFNLSNTSVEDRELLFQLALLERDNTLAESVLEKLLTDTHQDIDTYLFGIKSYVKERWWTSADALVLQFDARNPFDTVGRTLVYQEYMNDVAALTHDTAHLRLATNRVLQWVEPIHTHFVREYYFAEWDAFAWLFQLNEHQSPDSLLRIAERVRQELWRFRVIKDKIERPGESKHWKEWGTFTPLEVMEAEGLAPYWVTYRARGGGGSAPQLHADYWFPARGQPMSDTVRPVSGKVNLLCLGGDPNDWSTQFSPLVRRIRHWLTLYGSDRLAVTVVMPAAGELGNMNEDILSAQLFPTLAKEAEAWRWYWQEYARLPVAVAVQTQQGSWLPSPDGRLLLIKKIQFNEFWQHDPYYLDAVRSHPNIPNDSVYGLRPGEDLGACTIINRDGQIVFSSFRGLSYTYRETYADEEEVLQWLFQSKDSL